MIFKDPSPLNELQILSRQWRLDSYHFHQPMDFFRKKHGSGAEVSCAWRTCRSLGKQLPFLGPWARCHGEKCENTTGPSEQFETPLPRRSKISSCSADFYIAGVDFTLDPMARHCISCPVNSLTPPIPSAPSREHDLRGFGARNGGSHILRALKL